MDNHSLACFIDFEASSLSPESYPIEIAFSLEDGTIESHLIDPSGISSWKDWDDHAQSLHNISRSQLSNEGEAPLKISEIINQRLAGKILYSDVHDYDWGWCQKLFNAVDSSPAFKISDASFLFKNKLSETLPPSLTQIMANSQLTDEQLTSTLEKYSRQAWQALECTPHRAACDVKHLIEMWKLVTSL